MPASAVLRTYFRVLTTAFFCATPECSQNLATVLIVLARLGRVMVATHISAPTAFRYGKSFISSFSSSVCGALVLDRGLASVRAGTMLGLVVPKRPVSVADYRR